MIKLNLQLYRSEFGPFDRNAIVPKAGFSKSVQGYFFTRSYTITWFLFSITARLTWVSDYNQNRTEAHAANVLKYL